MTSMTARSRAAGSFVPSNWIRGHRLTADVIHARAVQRKDLRDWLKTNQPDFSDELFYPPHRNRATPARKHKSRKNLLAVRRNGFSAVSRLSLVF